MKTRVIVGIVAIPALVLLVFFAPLWSYSIAVGLISAGAAWEFLRCVDAEIPLRFKLYAAAAGLTMDGIGSTLRVSLTADPVEEVKAGIAILKATGLRKEGVNIISCPTCGRTDIDLFAVSAKVEELLKDFKKPITVAVMGCIVNGPGEAKHADYGLAGGLNEGVLFKKGEIVRKVPEGMLAEALYELIMLEERGV